MAFLDFLFGGDDAAIKKHTRRIADRNAQAEDREGSARWLADKGTEEALRGLFHRFNLQLEHSMKDQREKDYVLDLLAQHGATAAKVAREFAMTTPSFQYAVRIVERIEGAPAATEVLLELLAAERLDNEWKPEKKKTLLISLAERKDPRIVQAAARFLEDFDEGVRNAAVEAIAAQSGDDGREPLLAALTRKDEESTRIRGRLAEIFATRKWAVGDDAWLPTHLPDGYRLVEGRLVSAR